MTENQPAHIWYILLALFVTFLWATSFVIIKLVLDETSPILYASYRYLLASAILLTMIISNSNHRQAVREFKASDWRSLMIYGFVFIFLTQGAGYLTLSQLSAITLSFSLNFTTIFVVLFSFFLLKEKSTLTQIIFILLALIGGIIYFSPFNFGTSNSIGYIYVLVALGANIFSTIKARSINREKTYSPVVVTGISMSFGTIFLLLTGLLVEDMIPLTVPIIFSVLWLSIVNTAFAFTLWNKALQQIMAMEASIVLNTILPQITILSIIFLGDRPSATEWIGIIIIIISTFFVQYFGMKNQLEIE